MEERKRGEEREEEKRWTRWKMAGAGGDRAQPRSFTWTGLLFYLSIFPSFCLSTLFYSPLSPPSSLLMNIILFLSIFNASMHVSILYAVHQKEMDERLQIQ